MKNKQLNKTIKKELDFNIKSYLANNKLLTESTYEIGSFDAQKLKDELESHVDSKHISKLRETLQSFFEIAIDKGFDEPEIIDYIYNMIEDFL